MAIYRNIQMSFWTDTKIADDFSPKERYFYLYLLTNPLTSLCGCYEISKRRMASETGYTRKEVDELIEQLKKHEVIVYSEETKEVLVVNWHKHNWTSSEKFRKALWSEITLVKDEQFKEYLTDLYNGMDTVSIPYGYGSDTINVSDSLVSVHLDNNNINNNNIHSEGNKNARAREEKKKHGEYSHVLLTEKEEQKLHDEYGRLQTDAAIRFLDEYIEDKGYKSKSHYLAMRRWVFNAVAEGQSRSGIPMDSNPQQRRDYDPIIHFNT